MPLVLVPSAAALAHIIQGEAGGFGQRFEHRLTGLDHFSRNVRVRHLGRQMGGRAVWALPVTFPLIMAVCGVAAMLGIAAAGRRARYRALDPGAGIGGRWRPVEAVALTLIGARRR